MKSEKITNRRAAATAGRKAGAQGRLFDDSCGMAHGLELLGERWALFVVRELMLGPRRFGDVKGDLPGISANVLTQRLTELEARGIVRRETLPPPANVQVYGLTDWGYDAEPIVQEIGRWASRSPAHDTTLNFSPVSAMLSMRTMIDRAKSADMDLVVGFRFANVAFRGHVKAGAIAITREEPRDADILFAGTPPGLAQYLYGKRPLPDLAADGLLQATGPAKDLARFCALFGLPEKVAAVAA